MDWSEHISKMKKSDNILNQEIYVSVTLSNDSELKKMNKKYLDRDFTTDFLSFEIKDTFASGITLITDSANCSAHWT